MSRTIPQSGVREDGIAGQKRSSPGQSGDFALVGKAGQLRPDFDDARRVNLGKAERGLISTNDLEKARITFRMKESSPPPPMPQRRRY